MRVTTTKTMPTADPKRRTNRMLKGWRTLSFPSSTVIAATLVTVLACAPRAAQRGDTVLYASGADLQSINPLLTVHPLAREVQKHVLFVTLASYDEELVPQPRLARWEWDADRTKLTFTLRDDVRWHDGPVTTAVDVVTTLSLARDAAVGYSRSRDLDVVTNVEATDDQTVVVSFRSPQITFPDVFTDLPILPAHHFGGVDPATIRTHPFNAQPVGNGPYRFVEHRPNQRWVFARHESFPSDLGAATLDRFVVVVVDEAATKLAALTSGELDFAGINPAHAEFVQRDERLEVVDYPVQFAVGLVWNTRRSPFDDPRLRRALTATIDRQLLIDAYVYGYGTTADGPVAPDHPWADAGEAVAFDPEGAERELSALGWTPGPDGIRTRDGQRLSFRLMAATSGENALEQLVQAQLRVAGVDVELRVLELSTFLETAQSSERNFDAIVVGVPGTLSLSHVAAMFSGTGGPLAYSGWSAPRFDDAMDKVATAPTEDARAQAWADAQRLLTTDLPVTWLYHSRGVQGKNRRVIAPRPDIRGELAQLHLWSIRSTNP